MDEESHRQFKPKRRHPRTAAASRRRGVPRRERRSLGMTPQFVTPANSRAVVAPESRRRICAAAAGKKNAGRMPALRNQRSGAVLLAAGAGPELVLTRAATRSSAPMPLRHSETIRPGWTKNPTANLRRGVAIHARPMRRRYVATIPGALRGGATSYPGDRGRLIWRGGSAGRCAIVRADVRPGFCFRWRGGGLRESFRLPTVRE